MTEKYLQGKSAYPNISVPTYKLSFRSIPVKK